MIKMILSILAFLAVAAAITYVIKITFNWVRNKIREKLAKRNAKKIYMTEVNRLVEQMADNCDNKMTLDELENYDVVMATINDENEVEDVDLIKNTDDELDRDVDKWLSSNREIVITN